MKRIYFISDVTALINKAKKGSPWQAYLSKF